MICFTFWVVDSYYFFFIYCYFSVEDVRSHVVVIAFSVCLKLGYFFVLVALLFYWIIAFCTIIFFIAFFSTSILSSVFGVTLSEMNRVIYPFLFRKHSFLAFMRPSLIRIITLLEIHLYCHLLRSFIRLVQVLIHLKVHTAVIVQLFLDGKSEDLTYLI